MQDDFNSANYAGRQYKEGDIMRLWLGLALLISLMSAPVCAEFYRYKDKDGVLRYTDNLAEVPEDQQPATYKEMADFLPPEGQQKESSSESASGQEKKSTVEEKTEAAPETAGEESDPPALREEEKQFAEKRAELEKEYAGLVTERKTLAKEKDTTNSTESRKAYNGKVIKLNEKIEAYEKKRDEFQKEIEAFNAKMKK